MGETKCWDGSSTSKNYWANSSKSKRSPAIIGRTQSISTIGYSSMRLERTVTCYWVFFISSPLKHFDFSFDDANRSLKF